MNPEEFLKESKISLFNDLLICDGYYIEGINKDCLNNLMQAYADQQVEEFKKELIRTLRGQEHLIIQHMSENQWLVYEVSDVKNAIEETKLCQD